MTTNWYRLGLLAIVLAAPLAAAKPPIPPAPPEATAPPQTGAWLNADRQALDDARAAVSTQTGQQGAAAPLLPVIEELKALIESDPELYMLVTQIFDQIPREAPYLEDPLGNPAVRDYREMLQLMNGVLTQAPEFNKTGLVGFPINAILNWAMATPAGAATFLSNKVNAQLKKILNQWAVFLRSPDSRAVLNDDPEKGWFGRDALAAMPEFTRDFEPALPVSYSTIL
jgi:phosphatidylserine decarboxylase